MDGFVRWIVILVLATQAKAQTLVFEANEVLTASEDAPLNYRPRVIFTGDGASHIVWMMGDLSNRGVFVVSAAPGDTYGSAVMLSRYMDVGGAGPSLRVKGNFMVVGWEDVYLDNRGIWAASSDDMGSTWETAIRVDPQTEENRTCQAAGIFPDGRLSQLWMSYNSEWLYPDIKWTVQDTMGSFTDPMDVTAGFAWEICECCAPDQIILEDGRTVLVAFRNNDDNVREIHVARSGDGGVTFPEETRVDVSGWTLEGCPATGPGLAADGNSLLCSWMSVNADGAHIWLGRSPDGGLNWEHMRQVDDTGGDSNPNHPRVAIRDNLAVVVWQGTGTDGMPGIFASASVDTGRIWGEPVLVSDDSSSAVQSDPSVAISPNLEVEVAWSDSRLGPGRIYRARGQAAPLEITEDSPGLLPRSFLLKQNYPNPFNPSTTITCHVPGRDEMVSVSLEVYSLRGHLIKTLLDREDKPPGSYSVQWDGKDDQQQEVPSGIYFYRFVAGNRGETRRMVVCK